MNQRPLVLLASTFAVLLLIGACSSVKNVTGYHPTKKTYHEAVNIDNRLPTYVILHHTGCDYDTAFMLLATNKGKVSVHYLVDKDGTILQLVDEKKRAWHAGVSSWVGMTGLNNVSIGIEIVNNGHEPFPDRQMDSVMVLLSDLKARYKFPARNFIGHMDIAPGRKVDPSAYFPWKRLAGEGYGLWYDEAEARRMSTDSASLSKLRDPLFNLVLMGYSLKNPKVSMEAFKLHYTHSDKSGEMSDYDKCVLQLLTDRIVSDAVTSELSR